MFFQQTAAPTGWTKITDAAYNNVALRLVTGTVSSGGTEDFSTVFGLTETDEYVLTIPDIPLHGHPYRVTTGADIDADGLGGFALDQDNLTNRSAFTGTPSSNTGEQIGGTGGGGGHAHDIDLRVKYRDVILATKD
jgi:hypothetical protein